MRSNSARESASRVERVSSERRFGALVQNAPDPIAILDAEGAVEYISPSAVRVLGVATAELIGRSCFDLIHPADRGRCRAVFGAVAGRFGAAKRVEARVQGDGGESRNFELMFTNLLGEPTVHGIVVSARDVSEHTRREQLLRQRAFFDDITGLPKRGLFSDRVKQACNHARASGAVLALVLIDIDRFKAINDALGAADGDVLLGAIGRRLEGALRAIDTVTRLGGDEFAIVLEELTGPSGPRRVAERIIEALRTPFRIAGREVAVTASIGIALSAGQQAEPAGLMQHADIALYQAKAEGRASFVVFDAQIDGPALERLRVEAELRYSLERDELRVHYQPEVDVLTGVVVGVEALVRWQHPCRGLLEPAEFLPLAEETGLICAIDRWVLEQACRHAAAWRAMRPTAPFVLSVNLSARRLLQPTIVADVARVLHETGLMPDSLRMEITESAVIDDLDAAAQALNALAALGVQIAVDDFGTGYASFSYLRRFPITTLKIDREFVSSLDTDPGAETIVRAVAGLGHGLGMDVTLEGVETLRQLDLARQLHCDRVQGNFFWAPLPGEAIGEILAAAGA